MMFGECEDYKGSTCLASNHVLSLILYLNVIVTVA